MEQAPTGIAMITVDQTGENTITVAPGANREVGHSRTEFHDHPEPDRRRLLIRLWLRNAGAQGYMG